MKNILYLLCSALFFCFVFAEPVLSQNMTRSEIIKELKALKARITHLEEELGKVDQANTESETKQVYYEQLVV